MLNSRKTKGFTLIEILVVMALIAILAAITFIAINPQKNFADARNTQRQSDVREILSAITQYGSESGNSYSTLGTIPTCTTNVNNSAIIGTDNVDLASKLVTGYIVSIPVDPSNGTAANTGYKICTTGGRIQIDAPNAENGRVISVKR